MGKLSTYLYKQNRYSYIPTIHLALSVTCHIPTTHYCFRNCIKLVHGKIFLMGDVLLLQEVSIGVSLSKPHTSELGGTIFSVLLPVHTYRICTYASNIRCCMGGQAPTREGVPTRGKGSRKPIIKLVWWRGAATNFRAQGAGDMLLEKRYNVLRSCCFVI